MDRSDADYAAFYTLEYGESAVVADISEDWPYKLNDAVRSMGGVIHRKLNATNYLNDYARSHYADYLYPYYYEPRFI